VRSKPRRGKEGHSRTPGARSKQRDSFQGTTLGHGGDTENGAPGGQSGVKNVLVVKCEQLSEKSR